MSIPVSTLIMAGSAFLLNKALPSMFHHATDVRQATPAQVQAADELCKLGDCEAKKIQALQGMRKVILLPIPEGSPILPAVLPSPAK